MEFIIINFCLLYGIVLSIIFFFLLKKIMILLNLTNFLNTNLINGLGEFFFIRNQDFLKQQNSLAGLRVIKKKFFNDF